MWCALRAVRYPNHRKKCAEQPPFANKKNALTIVTDRLKIDALFGGGRSTTACLVLGLSDDVNLKFDPDLCG